MAVLDDITGTYSGEQMIGLGIAFIIIPVVAFAMRVTAKLVGRGGVSLDDYVLAIGVLFAVACNAILIGAALHGELGQHEQLGPDGTPLADPRFAVYEKCKLAINVLTAIGLSFIKASILLLYCRIFRTPGFLLTCHIMIGVVAAWGIAFFFSNLFICYPVTPFLEPFYGNNCYNGVPMWYTGCVSDLVIDIIILVLPVFPVVKLQLPPKQRLGVLAVFALGTTVVAISLARFLTYLQVGNSYLTHYLDETYYTSPTFFWNTIELSVAVVSACLPTYRPLWLFITRRSMTTANSASNYGPKSGYARRGFATFGSSNPKQRLDSEAGYDADSTELVNRGSQPGLNAPYSATVSSYGGHSPDKGHILVTTEHNVSSEPRGY